MWKYAILLVLTNIFKATFETNGLSFVSDGILSMTNDTKISHVNKKSRLNSKMGHNTNNDPEIKVVYGLEGTITCDITSSVPIQIHWYYANDTTGEDKQIGPSDKYWISADGAQLKINKMDLDLVGTYSCTAAYSTKVRIVLVAPQITGEVIAKATRGMIAVLKCKIIEGLPKPKISWQFMNNSGSKFVPIAGSDNMLRIPSVEDKHAGRYKCLAENAAGSDEHVTTFIVESPPRIISKKNKVYVGIEGDVALRIPCDVSGIPKPVIKWAINMKTIITKISEKYFADEDGALVILKPNVLYDTTSYMCNATNYIGFDNATFNAKIERSVTDFGNIHYVYLLEGETKKLECGMFRSQSRSVRWFIEGVEMNIGKPYLQIENATPIEDGNYTCRVSDKHGHAETHTYVVDVGHPPRFYYESNLIDDWRGDINHILSNCLHDAKPLPDVEWKFNGKVVTDQTLTDLGNAFTWGHYSCNVSNVHGSIQRGFDVKSKVCAIKRNFEDVQNMPLLLTEDLTWPKWETTKHHLMIRSGEKFIMSCSSRKGTPNAFQKFPKERKLTAYCDKQDTFLVDGKFYKFSDLHCNNGIHPSIIRKKVKCSTNTSELIRVGYEVSGFLEAYEVCFDYVYNMPLYSRVLMTETDGSPSNAHHWYKYPGLGDSSGDRGITCKGSSSSCCYGKSQLVDARDFNNDYAKNSTFIDPLNAIPYWRPCNNENTTWENIDDMVRIQLNNYNQFVAWSGIHTLQEKDEAVIPRFLWKVLKFDEDESVAIVHVNDPSPTDKDIKCKNICTEDTELWFEASSKYTYCCSLADFLEAFDMRGSNIGE